MAAVRHSLQKYLLEASNEKLIVHCEVTKLLKKKTGYILCLLMNPDSPKTVNVTQVKRLEKNGFKKKRSWLLSEIKNVDGGTESNVLTLDVTADKCYRWVANNERDRRQFVTMLAQIVRQQGASLTFTHFADSWFASIKDLPEVEQVASPMSLHPEPDDPSALGDLNEEELAALLGGCDLAVEDAEAFMRRLGDELLILDGQNVASVLASSKRVDALADKIEEAITYADALDKRLERYDDLLRHVRESVDKMEERNESIETTNRNGRALLNTLYTLIQWLDVSYPSGDMSLTTPEGRNTALELSRRIKAAFAYKPEPYLLKLGAVQQQLKTLTKRKEKLIQTVSRHVNNLLIHLSNDASSEMPLETLSLRSRDNIHNELLPFAQLVHFIKDIEDERSFNGLRKIYTSTMQKLYERDIKNLFDLAKQTITSTSVSINKKSRLNESREDLLSSAGADQVLQNVLSEVSRICSAEEEFCSQFFLLETPKNKESAETDSTGSEKRATAMGDETKLVMGEIFPKLEQDLLALVNHVDKHDTFGALRCVARLTGEVLASNSPRSWPCRIAAAALLAAKRAADKSVSDRLNTLHAQAKLTQKRNKCGLLPYLDAFQDFCTQCEDIFTNSGRRADLERWYLSYATSIVSAIATHEHPRTPHQVIKMENYHHLYDILSQLKLAPLEAIRKDVKTRYNDALKAYVTHYFGRPLDKLNQFFEGVNARVANGVREDEVLFQADLSKHQLRKVLALYTKKDVRKGLDQLYKTLEKHLSEEENLLQVVWRAMQEEFIAQYVYLEGRIQACYPGACINLLFTMQDILDAFSEIAQEH